MFYIVWTFTFNCYNLKLCLFEAAMSMPGVNHIKNILCLCRQISQSVCPFSTLYNILQVRQEPIKVENLTILLIIKLHQNVNAMYDLAGNTKGGSITVPLTSRLTGLDQSVFLIKTKIVSSHADNSKPVKQEVNHTVILPPLVFPA